MTIRASDFPPAIRQQVDKDMPPSLLPGVTNAARDKAILRDEKQLQNQVANELRRRGLWFDQDGMNRRRTGTIGTPDFLFPFHGRFVAFECKCPWSRKLRPEQESARDAIIAQGGEWRLITSLVEAMGHLRELEQI
jgi:hypothetical protein